MYKIDAYIDTHIRCTYTCDMCMHVYIYTYTRTCVSTAMLIHVHTYTRVLGTKVHLCSLASRRPENAAEFIIYIYVYIKHMSL